jgi:hypothetical protein
MSFRLQQSREIRVFKAFPGYDFGVDPGKE